MKSKQKLTKNTKIRKNRKTKFKKLKNYDNQRKYKDIISNDNKKKQTPKIVYINGYGGENSTKPQILSDFLNLCIEFVSVDYNSLNDEIYQGIKDKVKDADIIIASSTGSYFARKICEEYNITLISLNPVIDLQETFEKMKVMPPKLPKPDFQLLSEVIFVNDDDELIDYKKTLKKFQNQVSVYSGGGHRFTNIEETIPYLKKAIKFLLF